MLCYNPPMYYLLSLLNAFDGYAAVGIALALAIIVSSALLKFVRSLSGHISWKKTMLINTVSILNYIATTIIALVLGVFKGYSLFINQFMDERFGSQLYESGLLAMMLMALLSFILNFFIWGTFIIMWWFFQHKKTQSSKNGESLKGVAVGFMSLLIAPFMAFVFVVGVVRLSSSCAGTIIEEFNHFNAHIKSLCVEKKDTSECPKNEKELKNFNPAAYEKLTSCTKTIYTYSFQEENKAVWRVFTPDGGLFVSSKQYYPGFGYLHRHAE